MTPLAAYLKEVKQLAHGHGPCQVAEKGVRGGRD